jgi:hypothetical protein
LKKQFRKKIWIPYKSVLGIIPPPKYKNSMYIWC